MDGCGADAVRESFTRKRRRVPACVRKTLTYDQGFGVARHEELARRVRIRVCFADPHSPGSGPATRTPTA